VLGRNVRVLLCVMWMFNHMYVASIFFSGTFFRNLELCQVLVSLLLRVLKFL
jgi:hypothetical protein